MSDVFNLSGDFRSAILHIKSTVGGGSVEHLIPLHRPLRATHFTGREIELNRVLKELQLGRTVTLCGAGGIGKTALAAEVVWRLAPRANEPSKRFPDGIILHSFYNQPSADVALESIALAYGEEPKPTPQAAAQRALAGKRTLLVLDGTENADNLKKVLEVASGCGVLVTSRNSRDALGDWHDIRPLSERNAVKLLRAWGKEQIKDDKAAREICQLVGYLPLAVRLVGFYLIHHKPNIVTYLQWLRTSLLRALDQGQRREESVPLLLQRSIAQVGDSAQQALAVIALLAFAPFDSVVIVESFEVANFEAEDILGKLISYGLVQRFESHYEVTHSLIHTYTRERLAVPADVFERLTAWFIHFAEKSSAEGPDGYRYLDLERPHLLCLLDVCIGRHMWKVTKSLIYAMNSYLEMQGYWTERRMILEKGLLSAQTSGDKQDQGEFLVQLGTAFYSLGQVEKTIDCCKEALAIGKDLDKKAINKSSLSLLGAAYHYSGQMDNALHIYEQALAVAREVKDKKSEGMVLGNLGVAYGDLGQTEIAIDFHKQALSLSIEFDDEKNRSNQLGNLGLQHSALGQTEKYIEYTEQALALCRKIGYKRNEAIFLGNLGEAYAKLEDFKKAIEYLEQALEISKVIGDHRDQCNHLAGLGMIYRERKDLQTALRYLDQGLEIARKINLPRAEGLILANLGDVYRDKGQTEKSLGYLESAMVIYHEIGFRQGEGEVIESMGLSFSDMGRMDKAIDCHGQALDIARDIGNRLSEGISLENLGDAYNKLREHEKARQYWQEALTVYEDVHSPFAEEIRKNLSGLKAEGYGIN